MSVRTAGLAVLTGVACSVESQAEKRYRSCDAAPMIEAKAGGQA